MMDLISQDKKVKRGKLTFILVRGIGQAFVARDVDAAEVRAFLAEKLAATMTTFRLALDRRHPALPAAVVLLRRQRDRADGVVARRMLRLAQNGNRKAGIVNRLLAARERLIGALLLGNNAVNIAASSLATSVFLVWFGDVGVHLRHRVMTVLVVVFAEVLPKTIAFNAPDRMALMAARPMRWVVRAARPGAGGDRMRWCARSCALLGIRIGEDQPILAPHEECAAPSICCTARAASRSSTAT